MPECPIVRPARPRILRGCGSRLTYGVSTGEDGRKYAYYFCASRVNRTACTERRENLRPELIEAAILPEYHKVELTYPDLERRRPPFVRWPTLRRRAWSKCARPRPS
jgi:hypothetical protein